MMRLALAGKCTGLITPRDADAALAEAANKSFRSKEASAMAPMPVAPRPKKWRRVICWFKSSRKLMSFPGNCFVQIEKHVGHSGPRNQLDLVHVARPCGFANADKIQSTLQVLLVIGEHFFVNASYDFSLLRRG